MTALDEWHRERLSASAQARLHDFEKIRAMTSVSDESLVQAFHRFVAELSTRQVRVLARVLDELEAHRAFH